jgi:N-glycosylase/DNA lyase
MIQRGTLFLGPITLQIELPAPNVKVLPNIPWGSIEAFPSPAYWTFQVLARRVTGQSIRYRLGDSLKEEVAACILGGHGIPASVGVAAFRRLKARGVLGAEPSEQEIFEQLVEPLIVNERPVKYRFARQKARYLSTALRALPGMSPSMDSGRSLRDTLVELPGVGYKTASWIARNWLDADDVAILDIHVIRAGRLARFLASDLTVERDYLALESQFLRFSRAIGVRSSELDAVIWFEMASSSSTIHQLIASCNNELPATRSRRRAHVRRANSNQGILID